MDDPAEMLVFRPIQVGTMRLDHRLVFPSHSTGADRLLGTDEEFERYCAYWLARVKGGMQWVGGEPVHVFNPLLGEPSASGTTRPATVRHPMFAERMGTYIERVHSANGFVTVQLICDADFDSVTREFGEAAAFAAQAGADALEVVADLVRARGIVGRIRSTVGRPITIGFRVTLDGPAEDEHRFADLQKSIVALTADGTIDYFSLEVGGDSTDGPRFPLDQTERAELCGRVKESTHLPIVHVGRVLDLATAERVLAGGHADLVGFTRPAIADPEIVARSRRGEIHLVRPCVGVDDCMDRRVVEGVGVVCAANPHAGNERITRLPPVKRSQRVLVIGGGPAGMEFAALAKQRGHRVTLWERDSVLGGQFAVAAKARVNALFADWILWQQNRMQRLAVAVELCHEATLDDIEVVNPNLVVVATGAVPRPVVVPGIDAPFVHQTADVLMGHAQLGHRVVVVADDDSSAAAAVADHLSGLGHQVTVAYRAGGPSAVDDVFGSAASLGSLDLAGARFEPMAELVGVEPGRVHFAHTYSDRRWSIDGVDSVVLASVAVSDNALYLSLAQSRPNVHVIGDASAPRRMSAATRQAWQLASLLD